MSVRLRDLIRAVRSCKTAAQEREVIAKESAELREAFREQDTIFRHRNVAKLMFMHMLGYPTHFGQMEAVKLVASPSFAAKRMGYLALAILVDERQEVLMLVTNSVKNDLSSRDQYVAGLALACVANIASAGMARDLAPEVARLTRAPSAYLRKKAAAAAVRVLARVPELADTFVDAPVALLADKHHGALLGGAALATTVAALDPSSAVAYAAELPAGVTRLLRGLVGAGGAASDHDVGGVCDPWLQVALLRLLRDLATLGGPLSPADAASVADAVAAVAAAVDGSKSAGAAVLYEAARCALTPTSGGNASDDDGGLRALAVTVLGRFLASRDPNLRYVALDSLARLAAGDPAAVQRHRATVVACVRDGDASIRRRALELVCALATPANADALLKELTDYLAVTDTEFRPELAARLAALAARHARGPRALFDSLLRVMATPGARLDAAPARRCVVLVSNDAGAAAHAASACWRVLRGRGAPDDGPLRATALWFVGEYADDVVAGRGRDGGDDASSPPPSAADVAAVLAGYADPASPAGAVAPPADRAAALTALAKLAARAPADTASVALATAASRSTSRDVEEQTRAVEYGALLSAERAPLAAAVLDRVPPLDPAAHAAAADALPAPPGAESGAADLIGDLLTLDVGGGGGGGGGSGTAPPAVDPLADLLGGAAPAAAVTPATRVDAAGRAALPEDLFADPTPAAAAAPAPAPVSAAAPPPPSASSPILHAATALTARGVTVTLAFSKPDPDPAATAVTATLAADAPIHAVSVQAAVPKFCRLRLDPASGDAAGPPLPPLTQTLHITNTAHGVKPLALRLRVAWTTAGGESVVETAEVKGLPPTL